MSVGGSARRSRLILSSIAKDDLMILTAELLVPVVTMLIGLAGFVFGVLRWVLTQLRARDEAIDAERRARAQALDVERESRLLADQAEAARAKVAEDELRRSLEAHKLYAAKTFVSTHELAAALGRVEAAIERLTDRLDKWLVGQQGRGGQG